MKFILTKEEIDKLGYRIDDMQNGCICFVPVMQKGDRLALLDKKFDIVYMLIDGDIEQCYEKHTLENFKKLIDVLKKDGWILL